MEIGYKYRPNFNNDFEVKKSFIEQLLGVELTELITEKFSSEAYHNQNEFISYFRDINKKCFKKNKEKKYGNINKGFEDIEYNKFLEQEKHYKAKFVWQLQYLRALRIGEISLLNVNNINWDKKTMKIWTLKAKQWDEIIIEGKFETILKDWTTKYKTKIKKAKGFLLFSDNPTANRTVLSENWLAKQFRETRKLSDLEKTYSMTNESDKKRKSKPQYILTTHSLRHGSITNFYNKCHDIYLTMKFARHKDIKSTLVYVYHDQENLREALIKGKYDKYGEMFKNELEKILNQIKELQENSHATGNLTTPHNNTLFNYI